MCKLKNRIFFFFFPPEMFSPSDLPQDLRLMGESALSSVGRVT